MKKRTNGIGANKRIEEKNKYIFEVYIGNKKDKNCKWFWEKNDDVDWKHANIRCRDLGMEKTRRIGESLKDVFKMGVGSR